MKFLELDYKDEVIRGVIHGNSNKLFIMAHGFTGSRIDHHAFAVKLANLVETYGYSVLRFDFLGNGESSGNEEMYCTDCEIDQLQFVIDTYAPQYDEVVLYGFSYGGVIASQVAARNKDKIKNLILVNPAGNMSEILDIFTGLGRRLDDGFDFNGYHLSDTLIQSIKEKDLYAGIDAYDRHVFMIQSNSDEYVSKENFDTYRNIYKDSLSDFVLEDCTHCFAGIDQTQKLFEAVKTILEAIE